jgi:hypothetical protein
VCACSACVRGAGVVLVTASRPIKVIRVQIIRVIRGYQGIRFSRAIRLLRY